MSENLEADLVINIINLHSKIQKKVGTALSAHGIGLSEYLVLNQLYRAKNQKMRRSDLAEQVGLSPSGVTRLLNPMEKIGLVKKEESPRDARVSLVALSETGKTITEEATATFGYSSVSLLEVLDQQQLSSLSALLRVITK